MIKWDYTTKNVSHKEDETIEVILDKYGANGWELVCIYERKLIFKKPIQEKEKKK
jgi:hypothetical protein